MISPKRAKLSEDNHEEGQCDDKLLEDNPEEGQCDTADEEETDEEDILLGNDPIAEIIE